MDIKRNIKGDIDNAYENADLECVNIFSYVYSKGDLKSNKLSNKFYNLEILTNKSLYYTVETSGAVGGTCDNVMVTRIRNAEMARKIFLEKTNLKERQGYNKVEVVSIYPHCSLAARNFVQSKRVMSKNEAAQIKENTKVALKDRVKSVQKAEPILDEKVVSFVKNIYNEVGEELKRTLSSDLFKDDSNVLGMLSIRAIRQGRTILEKIAERQNKLAIVKRNKEKLLEEVAELSNSYNMTIPRKIKRNTTDWLIDTADKLAEQFDLVDLLELTLSNAVLNSTMGTDIMSKYTNLHSDIKLVTDEKVLKDIRDKMKIEQLDNHHEKVKLLNVFEVNQKNAPNFNDSCGNVVSLFHGTRAANLVSILSSCIKLPANLGPNVVITGRMFGSGVYFGQFSKALQYSVAKFGGTQNKGNKSYLFICDVALGKMKFETYGKNYGQAPQGYNSVMGVGRDAYTEGCYIKGVGEIKDFKIPAMTFKREIASRGPLLHNEYIVYNQSRFRIRYVIEVERLRG